MKRYLIHHGEGGTWDLVVSAECFTVEHAGESGRKTYSLDEFRNTEQGARLAQGLTLAIDRANES